jgi:hypothetical protein
MCRMSMMFLVMKHHGNQCFRVVLPPVKTCMHVDILSVGGGDFQIRT